MLFFKDIKSTLLYFRISSYSRKHGNKTKSNILYIFIYLDLVFTYTFRYASPPNKIKRTSSKVLILYVASLLNFI